MKGLVKYESLLDGTLDIVDIAILNDLLNVQSENEYRIAEYERTKHR